MIKIVDKGHKIRVSRLNGLLKDKIYYTEYSIIKAHVVDIKLDEDNSRVVVVMSNDYEYDFDHRAFDSSFKISKSITDNKTLFEYLDSLI